MSNVPSGWPAERPLAVSVSVMLEGWAAPDAPGIGPMGNPLKPGTVDLQARSWAEYGAKVGAWRLLDLLDQQRVRAVFYTSGVVAEHYPELAAAIAQRGHVVAAHGWSQGTLPAYLTQDAEAAEIDRCVDVLSRTAGAHPAGWLSPRCTPSAHTSRLLAKAGFRWHADIFDSDLPYPIPTEAGSLLGVPFTMEVNDMPLYVRYGNEPDAFTHTLEKIVAGWPRLGSPFGCLDITVHAHVFGRPVRGVGNVGLARSGAPASVVLADRSRPAGRGFHCGLIEPNSDVAWNAVPAGIFVLARFQSPAA